MRKKTKNQQGPPPAHTRIPTPPSPEIPRETLTDDQLAFVEEYTRDLDGARAVRAISKRADKASEAVQAAQWLANPLISQRVQERLRKLAEERGLSPQRIIDELIPIAFQDPRGVMSWGPDGVELRDSRDLTREDAICISEVSQTVSPGGGTLKIKLHDKLRALEMLGKHYAMWVDRMDVKHDAMSAVRDMTKEELEQRFEELRKGR